MTAAAARLLAEEALCLDERRWDDWLALYEEAASFWVPAWKSDGEPTGNPDAELSLIWCAPKSALAERVARVKSGRAVALMPPPRTLHQVSGVLVEAVPEGFRVRSAVAVHVYHPKRCATHVFFGRAEHRLVEREGRLRIAAKKVLLLNDHLPVPIDFFCV